MDIQILVDKLDLSDILIDDSSYYINRKYIEFRINKEMEYSLLLVFRDGEMILDTLYHFRMARNSICPFCKGKLSNKMCSAFSESKELREKLYERILNEPTFRVRAIMNGFKK